MKKEITTTKTQIDTLIDKIIDKVIKEYDIFKKDMLLKTSEFWIRHSIKCNSIKEDNYILLFFLKISSYTDLLYYFENNGFAEVIEGYFKYSSTNKDDIQKLEIFSNKDILPTLYESHFKYESLYLNLWEDINILIKYVIFEVN